MTDKLLEEAISNIKEKRVLVAPLNWGLGHATRCVPVIKSLLAKDKEVIIAGDGYPLRFLQGYFPQLHFIEFKWCNINYSKGSSQVLSILMQIPKILLATRREHIILNEIIDKYRVGCVISDNRFGLWNKKITTIYISHQIAVKVSSRVEWLNKMAYICHKFIINKYNVCLIPDFAGEDNLSGDLSHKYPLPKNARFVGPLSRFNV